MIAEVAKGKTISRMQTGVFKLLAALLFMSLPGPMFGFLFYVTNLDSNNVSVINTATNTVIATIPVGDGPTYLSITPDNTLIYVSNQNAGPPGTVSVISTASNTVIA